MYAGLLQLRLAPFGLAVAGVAALELRHEKHDTSLEPGPTLWLVAGKGAASMDHLAAIRMRTDLEVSQQAGRKENALAVQRFAHVLQQIGNQIAQALLIEDEAWPRTGPSGGTFLHPAATNSGWTG